MKWSAPRGPQMVRRALKTLRVEASFFVIRSAFDTLCVEGEVLT